MPPLFELGRDDATVLQLSQRCQVEQCSLYMHVGLMNTVAAQHESFLKRRVTLVHCCQVSVLQCSQVTWTKAYSRRACRAIKQ